MEIITRPYDSHEAPPRPLRQTPSKPSLEGAAVRG
jgi:hypothetical protein